MAQDEKSIRLGTSVWQRTSSGGWIRFSLRRTILAFSLLTVSIILLAWQATPYHGRTMQLEALFVPLILLFFGFVIWAWYRPLGLAISAQGIERRFTLRRRLHQQRNIQEIHLRTIKYSRDDPRQKHMATLHLTDKKAIVLFAFKSTQAAADLALPVCQEIARILKVSIRVEDLAPRDAV